MKGFPACVCAWWSSQMAAASVVPGMKKERNAPKKSNLSFLILLRTITIAPSSIRMLTRNSKSQFSRLQQEA